MPAFSELGYDIAPLLAELPEGWIDTSWRNDSCPSASPTEDLLLRLWFDYLDPHMSEVDWLRLDGKAFVFSLVDTENNMWFETDHWPEMAAWIRENTSRIADYCANNRHLA